MESSKTGQDQKTLIYVGCYGQTFISERETAH